MKDLLLFFSSPHELFNWLLALDDRDYETWDKGRISWHVRYQRAAARTQRPVENGAKFESSSNGAKFESSAKMMADQPSLSADMDKNNDDDEMVKRSMMICLTVIFQGTSCRNISYSFGFLRKCYNLFQKTLYFVVSLFHKYLWFHLERFKLVLKRITFLFW